MDPLSHPLSAHHPADRWGHVLLPSMAAEDGNTAWWLMDAIASYQGEATLNAE